MFCAFKFAIIATILSGLFWSPSTTQFTSSSSSGQKGIVVGRQDNNYDIVLYLNGQPLQANQQMNLQAFQQTMGIVLSNGQRIPPTAQVINGQLQTTSTPNGMVNLAVTIQRTYYGPIYGK